MTPTMPPDSHKISLKIIDAIKQHPVLYCAEVKGPSIKLQEFRQKVWKRISDELGLDPTWVRLKWKNLRDTYCRILKYKNKTEEGVRRKKWIFEDHLSFLKFPHESDYQPLCIELTEEYVQDINASDTSPEGLLEQLEDRNDEDYSEYLEILEETTADPVIIVPGKLETSNSSNLQQDVAANSHVIAQDDLYSYAQETQPKFRKIRPKKASTAYSIRQNVPNTCSLLKSKANAILDAGTIANPIIMASSTPAPITSIPVKKSNDTKYREIDHEQTYQSDNKSSTELFFASMAEMVKKLPPKAQADIKMNICKIVTEAEVRYSSGQDVARSAQQFTTPSSKIPKLVLIPCSKIDHKNSKDRSVLTTE